MGPERPRLRFLFDYISSNAYLAWLEMPRLAATYDVVVEPVPVLFAGLLEASGSLGPAEVRPKAHWMWKNNLRKAALLGVELRPPAFHPFNPLLPLRASSLDVSEAERAALVSGLFEAVWVGGLHASEPAVVEKVANEAGLDGRRVVEEAGTPELKRRLRDRTDAAIAEGVFGVPTMLVGDELFWGFDDLPYLERLLAGEDPLAGREIPRETIAPKASAVRRRRS